jgi:Fur family ferric uptake transcriptional regulator
MIRLPTIPEMGERLEGGQQMTVPSAAPTARFDKPEAVLNLLRGHGLRISTPRRLVLATLFDADAPITAEELGAVLRERGADVDIASVYRNLETLESAGVARHFHAGHGPGHYVLTGKGDREFLACESCGSIVVVDPTELDRARAEIQARFGYRVTFTHFPIVGRCPDCAQGLPSR